MDYILLVISFVFIILGILGSFLPILPGPAFSWLGILFLYFVDSIPFNYTIVIVLFIITVVITILDYFIPAQGTKRFGGSKYGVWGTNIGLIVGILTPIPFGFILGPFLGAFIGELLFDSKDLKKALKSASGSILGFLASTFIKFIYAMCFMGYYIYLVIQYKDVWF